MQAAIARLEERLAEQERRITELMLARARLLQLSHDSGAIDELLALNTALLVLAERGVRRTQADLTRRRSYALVDVGAKPIDRQNGDEFLNRVVRP